MRNLEAVSAMIRQLAGQQNTITIPKVFAKFMGSLEGGAFLNQLIYWSDKGRDGEFYKSYAEWQEEIMLSEYQVRKASNRCVELGFLTVDLRKANGAPTLHYRLDMPKFLESILKFLGIQESEIFQNGFPKVSGTYKQKITTDDYNRRPRQSEDRAPSAARPPSVYKSPHVDNSKFNRESGRIPEGTGTTAVEVYYERFCVFSREERLNEPMEDDLVVNCPDLDKLRAVIVAYSRAGFRNKRNIQLILDWYNNPHKMRSKSHAIPSSSNGGSYERPEPATFTQDEWRNFIANHEPEYPF